MTLEQCKASDLEEWVITLLLESVVLLQIMQNLTVGGAKATFFPLHGNRSMQGNDKYG